MNDTDEGRRDTSGRGLGALFALVVGLAIVDLVADWPEGWGHLIVEAAVAATGLVGLAWLVSRSRAALAEERAAKEAARGEATSLAGQLEASRAEAARWRAESSQLAGGLADAIDRQLEHWGLSPAEKEVALLLLKGLAHKEIAAIRQTGEATVRQQARAIYKKAGLGGRHDLAAFFLEDLLAPRSPEPAS